MRPSLLRNYLLISLSLMALFILLGAFAFNFIEHERLHDFESNHPIFFAKLIDEAKAPDREKFLEEIKNDLFFSDVWILNSNGSVKEKNTDKALNLDLTNFPKGVYEATQIRQNTFPAPPYTVVSLRGPEPKYMVFMPRPPPSQARHFGGPPHGPPPLGGGGPNREGFSPLLIPLAILVAAILIASLISFLILFLYLKKTSELADSVIGNIKSGNLKTRFPIKRMNEVGRLMNRFNLMADEIESLFERLKSKEANRIRLLQELAHDLRTPLASLTNMLSTISTNHDELPHKTKREMIDLSLRETNYLAKLVDDLLLLSQISEPGLELPHKAKHNLIDIIEGELEKLESIYSNSQSSLTIANELGHEAQYFDCDLQLMTRLFRNLFDNAFSFAKSEVRVSIQNEAHRMHIFISNDGEGFSPAGLAQFGERKATRIIQGPSKERISVGLGSVIIKTIAQIHQIEVIPTNRIDVHNQICGAQIELVLPK